MIGPRVIFFIKHASIKHILAKSDYKPRLIQWILLLPKIDLEIKDKKGRENNVAHHLSRLANDEVTTLEPEVLDEFPNGKLLVIEERPDITNFKASGAILENWDWNQRRNFLKHVNHYVWDDPRFF